MFTQLVKGRFEGSAAKPQWTVFNETGDHGSIDVEPDDGSDKHMVGHESEGRTRIATRRNRRNALAYRICPPLSAALEASCAE